MWTLVILDKHGAPLFRSSFSNPEKVGRFVEATLGMFLVEGADRYIVTGGGERRVEYAAREALACLELSKSYSADG